MIVKQTPQNIKFKRIIFDRTEVMYCSPIYFKNNNNEAYFFFVIDSKTRLKPVCIYLYTYRESDGKWCTEDYDYFFFKYILRFCGRPNHAFGSDEYTKGQLKNNQVVFIEVVPPEKNNLK